VEKRDIGCCAAVFETLAFRVKLNDVAQRFPAGHRIRLSLSTSYWPLAWPPPRRTRLTLRFGGCQLRLPLRAPRENDGPSPFPPPESAPALKRVMKREPESAWRVVRDLAGDVSTLEVINDRGIRLFPETDWAMGVRAEERYTVFDDDFDSPEAYAEWRRIYRRGEWQVRTHTRTRMTFHAERHRGYD
jgi:hypothetical protein